MLRCKTGDLAVVQGYKLAEMNGRFVTVCEHIPTGTVIEVCGVQFMAVEPSWWITSNRPLPSNFGPLDRTAVVDRVLRPIRGQEGEDEMLRIAGKPRKNWKDIPPTNVFKDIQEMAHRLK